MECDHFLITSGLIYGKVVDPDSPVFSHSYLATVTLLPIARCHEAMNHGR
jgi:hypothetical protein